MNLPLHMGLLGALEAGLIAFAIAVLVYALWHGLSRAFGFSVGHVIGWGSLCAAAVAAGLDAWNLFSLGFMRLESPLYAKLALAGIHDVDSLGTRVVCELTGVGLGIVLGWWLFSHRSAANRRAQGHGNASNSP